MERGPLALFGAILAVGLGPALWLGAQLGAVDLAPGQRPAPVGEQFPAADLDLGGAGAGEMPDDEPLRTYPYTTPTSPAVVRPSAADAGDSRSVPPVPPPPPSPSSTPSSSSSSSASPSAPASRSAGPVGSPSASSASPPTEPSQSVSASADAAPENPAEKK